VSAGRTKNKEQRTGGEGTREQRNKGTKRKSQEPRDIWAWVPGAQRNKGNAKNQEPGAARSGREVFPQYFYASSRRPGTKPTNQEPEQRLRGRVDFHKDAPAGLSCYDASGTFHADTQAYHREECGVYPAFAVMIGFMFGFIVAEIAHRYFEIDLPMFF
jgi:hypothetical protein